MARTVGAMLWLILLVISSCDSGAARHNARATPSGSTSSAVAARAGFQEPFEAPGADGWGRAGQLRYLERILAGGDSAQPLPLVIMIHGMGDAPRLDWFTEADAIKTPMRLIMPQAPTPYYDGFAWFPYDPAARDPDALARAIAAARDQLARTIEILRARRATVGRVIVAGFSQGGMLSYALALRYPALIAVSHPIAGLLPEPLWPNERPRGVHFPRILAMHGDRDDLVPIAAARALHTQLSARGYDNTLREFAGVRHQISPEMAAYAVELLESAARNILQDGS